MLKSTILGAIIGGVIAFAWSCAAWMFFPYFTKQINEFRNEEFVGWVMKENAKKNGVYAIPSPHIQDKKEEAEKRKEGPYIFVNIVKKGFTIGTPQFIIGFLIQAAAGAIIGAIMGLAAPLTYIGRVLMVSSYGLVAGILGALPGWNWWGFPIRYCGLIVLSGVIAWTLAGLVLAIFVRRK